MTAKKPLTILLASPRGFCAGVDRAIQIVERAIERSVRCVTERDSSLGEKVKIDDREINRVEVEIDDICRHLLSLQAPNPSDLRFITTALKIVVDLERMGDLANHIAKLARMRFPSNAVPAELAPTIQEMGKTAGTIIEKMLVVVEHRDIVRAIEIEKDDDAMDVLHRNIIATLLDDDWKHGIETAIDMTLLARYYERCADHAVSICRRVYFLVTGEYAPPQNQ